MLRLCLDLASVSEADQKWDDKSRPDLKGTLTITDPEITEVKRRIRKKHT